MFNQIINTVMKKPAAKRRLTQVLPIIRAMSAAQRLTLATLVLKQLTFSKFPTDQLDNKTLELMLPISIDITSMFQSIKKEAQNARSSAFRVISFYTV